MKTEHRQACPYPCEKSSSHSQLILSASVFEKPVCKGGLTTELAGDLSPGIRFLAYRLGRAFGHLEGILGYNEVVRVVASADLLAVAAVTERFHLRLSLEFILYVSTEAASGRHGEMLDE